MPTFNNLKRTDVEVCDFNDYRYLLLGSIDFIDNKIYGVLFVVVNACLISFIKYGGKDKK